MSLREKIFYKIYMSGVVSSDPKSDWEYLRYVSKHTGWSLKKTKEKMDAAKKLGISYRYYAKKRLWSRSEKQLKISGRNAAARKKKNLEIRHKAIAGVAEATGWSKEEISDKMRVAKKNCGSSAKDYWMFQLYKLTPEQQREYFTIGVFDALAFKYNPEPKAINVLLNKARFAKKFDPLFNRVWFMNRNLTFEEFCEYTKDLNEIICKPLNATQGQGVHKINLVGADKQAIYDELMAQKKTLCEEVIVQHPDIAAFNESSVNTVRVLTIVDQGKCHHIYAGFRMGRGKLVDNFHAGGIIASVDVKTGITCMDAIDLEGNHYPTHPVSGLDTLGFQLPNWQTVLDITEKAALQLAPEGAALVGWDVAITPEGACLVEGNSEPSHTIIQLPYVRDGVGMKKIVAQFLD